MVDYLKLGYESLNDYSVDFIETLLESNRTYEFYVDWDKVFSNLQHYLIEISILNSLNKVSSNNLEAHFRKILEKYPEVVPVLPSILAIRLKKVPIFDIDSKQFKLINFSKNNFILDEIVDFSIKSGLLDLFNNIEDLYSYLVGTEVGLDTNARKNRSGHIFEDIVGNLLELKLNSYKDFNILKEDSSVLINRNKRFDYVIYKEDIPIIAIECNFYNSTGSKPIETAHAYVDLQKDLDEHNIKFLWITDGYGWKKMFSTLMGVSEDIEYILNYNMLNNKFDIIMKEYL